MIIQNPKYKLVYASFEQESNKSYVTLLGSETGIPAVAPATDSTIVAKTEIPVGTSVSLPGGYKLVYFKDGKIYGSASGIPAGGDAEIDTGDLFIGTDDIVSIAVKSQPTKSTFTDGTDVNYDFTGLEISGTQRDGVVRVLASTEYTLDPADGSAITYPTEAGTETVTVTVTAGAATATFTVSIVKE